MLMLEPGTDTLAVTRTPKVASRAQAEGRLVDRQRGLVRGSNSRDRIGNSLAWRVSGAPSNADFDPGDINGWSGSSPDCGDIHTVCK